MAIKATGQITIVDLSDNRQLSVYLTANLPKTQILDLSTGTASPDWTQENLEITPNILLNQVAIPLTDKNLTVTYKRKDGSGAESSLVAGETVTNKVLKVNANVLNNSDAKSITYLCYVSYLDTKLEMTVKAQADINFSLVTSGTQGIGISEIKEYYYNSESATELTGGEWVDTYPGWEKNKYTWTKSIITYTNNTTSETDAICVSGTDGKDGTNGKDGEDGKDGTDGSDGRGIVSTTIEYQSSASGTETPTGTWEPSVPEVAAGNYLWTRTTINYTDNTDSVSYSVSYVAKDGENGSSGSDGIGISKTNITYQKSTNGQTVPTGTWVTSIPPVDAGEYLWTRTEFIYTDNSKKYAYSVGQMGKTGQTGEAGVGITSVDVYYYLSTSPTELTGGSWVTTAPEWVNGSYMWSKTVTTYTKGEPTETDPVCITGAKGEDAEPVITFLPAQGENLTLEQSGGNGFKKIHIYGNTEQATRSGKNLCPMSVFDTMGSNGAANTYDATTHTITMTADSTGNSGRYISSYHWGLTIGEAYTVSFDIRGTAGKKVQCGWDKQRVTITLTSNYVRYNVTYIPTKTNEPISFYSASASSGGLVSGEYMQFANVQIEAGEVATEYEEYGAMPSPEFPSEIENVEGKNLLENTATTQTIKGITYTVNNDKTVTVNGTADSTSNSQLYINRELKLQPGTYTIPKEGKQGDYWFFINLYNDKTYVKTKILSYNDSTTFTINSEESNYRCDIGIEVQKGKSVPNVTFHPQIEKGTIITEYVPYNSLAVKVTGKNLYEIKGTTNRGVEGSLLSSGYLKVNGTPTGSYSDCTLANTRNLLAGNYSISITSPQTFNVALRVTYEDDTNDTFTINIGETSKTIITTKNIVSYRVLISGLTTGTDINSSFGFMLKQGTEATSYEPYKEQIIYFPLAEGQKLMKGSYLADDGVHNTRKHIVLDGSDDEKWAISDGGLTSSINKYFTCNSTNNIAKRKGVMICDYFEKKSIWNYDVIGMAYEGSTATYSIRIRSSQTTIEEWKAWLTEHPITVEYELAEEEIVPYTEKQQQAYYDIKTKSTFYGLNYVNCIGTLPIYLDTEYWTWFKGESGIDIQAVKINPSTQFFKSTSGTNGIFNPEYIYLYPSFQNVDYSKWQYSTDGTTWTDVVSGSNGLTIATYNSVNNSLRIQNTSDLFTNIITSINFRCVSSTNAIYDSCTITKLYDANSEIIVGTQTAATNIWTGIASFAKLVDGQQIVYWLPYAGTSSSATLELTLADGTTTGAKNLYYQGTTRMTTHYPAGSVIHLTYRENVSIAGSTTKYTGWWGDANYTGSDTYDRIRYNSAITAITAISSGRIITGTASGFKHIAANTAFDINKPILYTGSAIAAAATGSNNYIAYSNLNLASTKSGFTGTKGKTVYIVGTLNGTAFTPNSTLFTTTEPITDDGLVYIALGVMSSTTNSTLFPEHPLYKFVNGKFQTLSQVAFEAQDNLDNLQIGGRNLATKDTICPYSSGSTTVDNSNFVASGTSIISRTAVANEGPIIDRYVYYEEGEKYVISYKMRTTVGTVNDIYFWNDGTSKHTNSSVYVDGVYKNTLRKSITIPADTEWHRVEIYFTAAAITAEQAESGGSSSHIIFQPEKGDSTVAYTIEITAFKIEKGDKATDWTPAPEDMATSNQLTSESQSLRDIINQQNTDIRNDVKTNMENLKTEIENDYGEAISVSASATKKEIDATTGQKIRDLEKYTSNFVVDGSSLNYSIGKTKGINLIKNSVMLQNKQNANSQTKANFWLNKNLQEDFFTNVTCSDVDSIRAKTDSGSAIIFDYSTDATGLTYDYILSSPIDFKLNTDNIMLSYKIKGVVTAGTFFVGLIFYQKDNTATGLGATTAFAQTTGIPTAHYLALNEYTATEYTDFTQDYVLRTTPFVKSGKKNVTWTCEVSEENTITLPYEPYLVNGSCEVTIYNLDNTISSVAATGRTVSLNKEMEDGTIEEKEWPSAVAVSYDRAISNFTGTTATSITNTDFDNVLVNEVLMYYNTSDKQIWVYNPFTGTYVKSTSEYSKYNDTDYSTIDSVRIIMGVRGASTSAKFKGHVEVSDVKVEYDSLSPIWTQHPGETYSKQYTMDEKGFSISSDTNMMFIDEDEIAAYTLDTEGKPNTNDPVFQISGEKTILKKTIVKEDLLIENDTQSSDDAFIMKQYYVNGQWFFLFY